MDKATNTPWVLPSNAECVEWLDENAIFGGNGGWRIGTDWFTWDDAVVAARRHIMDSRSTVGLRGTVTLDICPDLTGKIWRNASWWVIGIYDRKDKQVYAHAVADEEMAQIRFDDVRHPGVVKELERQTASIMKAYHRGRKSAGLRRARHFVDMWVVLPRRNAWHVLSEEAKRRARNIARRKGER